MNLSFPAESPYKKNLNEFVCDCAFAQRTYIQPCQKSRDVTALSRIVSSFLFVDVKNFFQMIGNHLFNKRHILQTHHQFEILFENDVRKYSETHSLSKETIQFAIGQSKEREKSLSISLSSLAENIYLSTAQVEKIEKKIWKKFFADISLSYGIELISYKKIAEEKTLKQKIKKFDCNAYAFYKTENDLALSVEKHLRPVHKKINENDSLLHVFMNILKYQVVQERNKGDLILYFDENKKFQHIGICLDSKLIESKWGKLPVFRHLPENAPYENSFLILRPSTIRLTVS